MTPEQADLLIGVIRNGFTVVSIQLFIIVVSLAFRSNK
jgi:hypothetical protein